ncbi:flagellar biosynthesis protein FlgJ [Endozoicomonas sp. OPT23]|uniref:glucosaminidase domain-containing protein n=1 Tax=Endozoicomonas sp. OPT23 TaxID=2072845 RepID=UPI00129A39D1|nr:glucosaminidase domain-containing protein [Endozoicomonas sp. OPT23]MRI32488.1 flagellar biosynthesis protein FlgJ [Endozoicomonas sp. OPT23]
MNSRTDVYFLALLAGVLTFSSWYNLNKPPVEEKAEEKTVQIKPKEPEKKPEPKPVPSDIPDFAGILDVKKKKAAFFSYMKTMVDQENYRLEQVRDRILRLQQAESRSEQDNAWLLKTARSYRLKSITIVDSRLFEALLNRVDEIPASLALVQAANESAWGTSRFAKQANNLYGQWCFSEGCGVIPEGRPEGKTYEVRKFKSPLASVRSYMFNLNTSHHYEALREMRAGRRGMGEAVTGPVLAHGLYAYSIRGSAYVDELIAMINSNDLLKYDLNEQ